MAAVCAAVLLAPAAEAAGEVGASASLGYVGNRNSDGISTDSFRQFYQLVFSRPLSESLSFSIGVDYQDDIGQASTFVPGTGDVSTKLSSRYLLPKASLTWRLGDVLLQAGYNYTINWYLNPLVDGTARRQLSTGSASAGWTPSKELLLQLSADTMSTSDTAVTAESWNWRTSALADWRILPSLRFRGEGRVFSNGTRDTVTLNEVDRLTFGPRLALSYEDQWGPAVNVSFSYTVEGFQSKDTLKAGTGSGGVQVEWFPVSALNGITDVPSDTTLDPLVQNPALIDRNFVVSAGPSLGPDGASFWNLAADMGRVMEIEQFRVSVRDGNGNVVPSGGLVTWSAYTSTDGQRWIEVPVLSQSFDPRQSAYLVAFARNAARYFKVVNFGTNSLAAYVTEIQVYSVEGLQGDQVRYTTTLLQIGLGSVSARVLERLVLTWTGLANVTRGWVQTTIADNRDFQTTVSAVAGPFADFTTTFTSSWRSSSTAGFGDQSSLSNSILVQYLPIPRFEVSANLGAFRDQVNDVISNTYALNLSSRLRLYEAMRFQLSGTLSRQYVGPVITDYLGVGAWAEFDLLRDLRFTARASVTEAVASTGGTLPPDALLIPRPQQYQTYYGELRYFPSVQLNLQARVGWVATANGESGLLQNYRASWSPFMDGAIQINTAFEQDINLVDGRTFQRATIWPHWQINPWASLDLNYNYTSITRRDLPQSRLQSFFATLTLVY